MEAFCAQKDYPFLIVNPQSAKAAGGEPTANSFLKCINHKGNSILSYFYVEMKALGSNLYPSAIFKSLGSLKKNDECISMIDPREPQDDQRGKS